MSNRISSQRASKGIIQKTALMTHISYINLEAFFSFILFPLLCGVDVARSYTSSADSPFSLMSSFTLSNHLLLCLPSPLYFHYHRPPSYVVFLSSHDMPIPLQTSFLYFLCAFPTFVVPLILTFLILSSFVTPHIHGRILISATSNFFLHKGIPRRANEAYARV